MLLKKVAASGLLVAAVQGQAANLIINGDFEDTLTTFVQASSNNGGAGDFATYHTIGPILGGSWNQDAVSAFGGSILVKGNSFSISGTQIPPGPSSGQQWLYLTSNGALGPKISQDVALPAGNYDLAFDLAGWVVPVSPGGWKVRVELKNGTGTVFSQSFSGTGGIWTEFSGNAVILNPGTYNLSFLVDGPASPNWATLDNVRLTAAIPEPEGYAMLLVGLGVVGFAARHRTQLQSLRRRRHPRIPVS